MITHKLLFGCIAALLAVSVVAAGTIVIHTHPVMAALERMVGGMTTGETGLEGIVAGTAIENPNNITITTRDSVDYGMIHDAMANGANCSTFTTILCAWGDGQGTSYGTPQAVTTWRGPHGRYCASACSSQGFAFVVLVQ